MRALGLISGTSLDGIDVALVDLRPRGNGYTVELERFETVPFEPGLRERLVKALPPNGGTVALAAELHADTGAAFAAAAAAVVRGAPVDYAATHGVTLYHDGARATTLQIGRPYELRETLGATVVWDFRSGDCALGGEGAPLVPYVDALLLGSDEEDRVAVNVGGICNLTALARGRPASEAVAFDCGPGNMLLDAFVRERTGEAYDRDGRLASAGTVDETLLATLLEDPYFARTPPKSTGRERFGVQLLAAHNAYLRGMSVEDGCATLTAFTARPLAAAIRRYGGERPYVLVAGGGVHNLAFLAQLRALLPGVRVDGSGSAGLDPDAKEAVAFAILGYETLRGRPANLPGVTGARGGVVLGSIVPHDLRALLAKLDDEMTGNA